MRLSPKILSSTWLCVLASLGCADRQSVATNAQTTSPTSADSDGDLNYESPEASEGNVASDCTKKDCDKVDLVLKLVDMKTGGNIDELKGYSKVPVTWGLKVVTKKTTSSGRQILLKIDGAPDELEVASKANTVVILGSFNEPTSGSLNVRYRDVDYCEQEHSDKEECSDIDTELEDIDETDTGAYRIIQSTQDQAQAAAEQKAKSQQSQANTANCMAGLFTAVLGNVAGAAGCTGAIVGGVQ